MELARRVRLQHERITLTRNGEAEAVMMSVDDLEGMEMTLEILGDSEAAARIAESLAELGRGEPGADLATVRQDLARRRSQAGDAGPREPLRRPLSARRSPGHLAPAAETVAAAVLEFCDAALALSPHRVGKPLFGSLAGCHGARRGTYRIVYRIDDPTRTVHVLDIDHRADIYHRP